MVQYEILGDSMLIQLSKLFSVADYEENITGHIDIEEIQMGQESYQIRGKENFPVKIKNHGKREVSIELSTSVTIGIPCSRCLEEVLVPMDINVFQIVNGDDIEQSCENELPFIEESNLDVDELISEEIIPLLPTKVLCSDECKGLCPVCGTNLNKESCDCDTTVPDPRMAAIQDIFKNFKEV